MQISEIPNKLQKAFAASGTKNTIPVNSQIGVTPGAASLTDGFPPLTMTPLAAGGVPPFGADANGILNWLSTICQWSNAGGQYVYDATFSTAVGGYPKGAVLPKASGNGYWLCLADNTTTDPDTGGSGWADSRTLAYGVDAGSANTVQANFPVPVATLVDGMAVQVKIAAANTGVTTFTPNPGVISTAPVVGAAHQPLTGGELYAGGRATFIWRQDISTWVLTRCSGGSIQIASGIAGSHAATLGQIQQRSFATAADTGTANVYSVVLSPAPAALIAGMMVTLQNIQASNTGASTLNVNGLGAKPIQGVAGNALQGGELLATFDALLMLNPAGNAWVLIQTTGGSLPVAPGTQSDHAVNLGQFGASLSTNGYQKFPTGLIMQWGLAYTNSSGQAVVTFPIAFPNNLFRAIINPIGGNFTVGVMNSSSLSGINQNIVIANTNAPAGAGLSVGFAVYGN